MAAFEIAEHRERLERVQAGLRRQAVDVLWINTEPELFWLTGFSTAFWLSPTRNWHLLVPANGDPVAVIPSIGEACYARTGFSEIRTFDSPHPHNLGIDLLIDTVTELAGVAPRVGRLEGPGTHQRVPLGDIHVLESRLPRAEWCDLTPLMHRLRYIKSEAEIARVRTTCEKLSAVYDSVPSLLSEATTGATLFRNVRARAHALGIDEVPYLVGGSGAGGICDIISPPGERAITNGDVLMLDSGCRHQGYYADFDRNWAVGTAGDAVRSAYRVAWDATEAGLTAARPGIRCQELYQIMHEVLAPHDTDTSGHVGRLGHGLGIELTESPSLTPHDDTRLQPGMVLTLEPALQYGGQYIMVHEENIVITDSGCELLSRRATEEIPII